MTGLPPSQHPVYDPPPGPPPSHVAQYHPPALVPTSFPLISPEQVSSLVSKGFTSIPISQRPALLEAATTLFRVSRTFFDQPQPQKSCFQVQTANAQGSEEGWSRVAGEKELLTIRRAGAKMCPPSVETEARALWQECGVFMQEMIRGVEHSLGMTPGVFDGLVSAECVLPDEGAERHETLLRMFRYERPTEEDDTGEKKGRLVAESHFDLGLLSIVIGASPGLEVWDITANAWIPIEEPPHAQPEGNITATLLVGETLTRLTNARYAPGRHRVFVPPASDPFRFSLVFALRPHAHGIIFTAALTTPITGVFSYPMEGIHAKNFFAAIARTHWNVNAAVQVRETQRSRLQSGKGSKEESDGLTSREKKRWSLTSRPDLPDGGKRKRWSLFQRVLRL